MKVKHKNSGEIVNLSAPNYGKHFDSFYGFLVLSGSQIWFFYIIDDELYSENLTNDYEMHDLEQKKAFEEVRQEFAKEVSKYPVKENIALRTKADTLLIVFDQLNEKQ